MISGHSYYFANMSYTFILMVIVWLVGFIHCLFVNAVYNFGIVQFYSSPTHSPADKVKQTNTNNPGPIPFSFSRSWLYLLVPWEEGTDSLAHMHMVTFSCSEEGILRCLIANLDFSKICDSVMELNRKIEYMSNNFSMYVSMRSFCIWNSLTYSVVILDWLILF